MANSARVLILLFVLFFAGCSDPWDKAVFPVEAYKTGFILKDKIRISRAAVYTFFLGFNCTDCSGNAEKIIKFGNLLSIDRKNKDSANILVRMKVFNGNDVYLEGDFKVDYFGSSFYVSAPADLKVTVGIISGADLEPGEYEFELEILEGDSRLEKYRSFFLMEYYNPKV